MSHLWRIAARMPFFTSLPEPESTSSKRSVAIVVLLTTRLASSGMANSPSSTGTSGNSSQRYEIPILARTSPVIGEKPMSEIARPKPAVSRPFTIAPELSSATVAMPSSPSRKNSAAPKSLSNSRATGSTAISRAAPTTPPISDDT